MEEIIIRRFCFEIKHPERLDANFSLNDKLNLEQSSIFAYLDTQGIKYIPESVDLKSLKILSTTSKYIMEIATVIPSAIEIPPDVIIDNKEQTLTLKSGAGEYYDLTLDKEEIALFARLFANTLINWKNIKS